MARRRIIDPGFFTNDELADLDFFQRLLFIGLWCIADREGRLEYRPRRIKGELFPYEDCNVEDGLSALEHAGFVHVYGNGTVERAYLSIPTFLEYQKPHNRERKSKIPQCPCCIQTITHLGSASNAPRQLEDRSLDAKVDWENNPERESDSVTDTDSKRREETPTQHNDNQCSEMDCYEPSLPDSQFCAACNALHTATSL